MSALFLFVHKFYGENYKMGTLTNFDNQTVRCRSCRAIIGFERLDRQVLIINQTAIFNFARFACVRCEKFGEWSSPNLLNKSDINNPDDVPKVKFDKGILSRQS